MISDEAVEAAAKSIARATIERESKLLHQFFPASDFKSDARAALEAAAPHMLADKDAEIDRLRAHILDIDAHATPFGQAGHDHMIGKQSTNPYRSQA